MFVIRARGVIQNVTKMLVELIITKNISIQLNKIVLKCDPLHKVYKIFIVVKIIRINSQEST